MHPAAHSMDRRHANAAIIAPRPLPRCSAIPNQGYWKHRDRDILAEIQWMARRGSIAVIPVPDDAKGIEGFSPFPAGWRAYGFNVPASGVLHVRLHHPNEGWFSLKLVDKWGGQEKGMLQVPIYTGNPEVTYTNPFKEPRAVFVIVDDPGWMSGEKNLYTLSLEKSWKPSEYLDANKLVAAGIWAVKPSDAPAPVPEKKVVPAEKKG